MKAQRTLETTRRLAHRFKTAMIATTLVIGWNGLGVSNLRPQAWEARALPTELRPHQTPKNTRRLACRARVSEENGQTGATITGSLCSRIP